MNPQIHGNSAHGPSFSFRNRMMRAAWSIIYYVLFRFSPRPLHGYRAVLLKIFGAKIGKKAHVYPSARIWAPWNLILGAGSALGDDVDIYNQTTISIGERTIVSQGVTLCAGTHDYSKREFPLITLPISIGSDVWLASKVFVHPGVTISDGVVVGACSVVIRDLEPWNVYSGFPCRVIKKREIS